MIKIKSSPLSISFCTNKHFHTQELRQASQEDHQRIFSALVARDADGARQAMRNHLERVIGEFAQGWR